MPRSSTSCLVSAPTYARSISVGRPSGIEYKRMRERPIAMDLGGNWSPFISEHRPAVSAPVKIIESKGGEAVVVPIVVVVYEEGPTPVAHDGLSARPNDVAMCCEQKCNSALGHRKPPTVIVGPGGARGAPHPYVISAVHTLTAEVERDEEVVVTPVTINVGAFNRIEIRDPVCEMKTSGSARHFARCLIELDDIDASVIGSKGQPRCVIFI